MTVRVTQAMLYDQALRDIRRSLVGQVRLQQQISSGLRVNRPSDDPAATLRILPLSAEIGNMTQMIENAALARETIDLGASALEEASEILQRVRELTTQGANGTLSESDRESLAEEVDQLLQQMVTLGNTQRGSRFLFGGTVDDTAPFSLVDDQGGTRVVYGGSDQSLTIEVGPGITTTINQPGSHIFQNHDRGATTFAGTTGAAPGAGFDTGVGLDTLEVTFAGLDVPGTVTGIAQGAGTTTALGTMNYTFTAPDQLSINGGAPVTVVAGTNNIAVGGANLSLDITLPITPASGTFTSRANLSIDGGASTQLVDFSSSPVLVTDSFDGSVLSVDVSGLSEVGSERVTYQGTFDAFSTLVSVRDVLRGDYSSDPAEGADRLREMLGAVDEAHDQILEGLRSHGFRSQNMDLIANRVETLKLADTDTLSRIRDTDIVEAITRFQQQDIAYQAALQIGARVVQTSLLNFLR